ncbi:Structural maintenance of chromosomes protein 6, partial [Ataeniobius toweri]|nr:Structural maintenance of chromosomes protein 6 [Ataeniobius toweri]
GKSAILTALIVGLGGKATMTNRGVSLKDFVKTGESTADVTVKLRNRGVDAYKKDLYGDYITVEQRISSDGSRSYKLKNKSGDFSQIQISFCIIVNLLIPLTHGFANTKS